MNAKMVADKPAPRAKATPRVAPKKPVAKKPARKGAADDLSNLSPTTRRLVEALHRLYGNA